MKLIKRRPNIRLILSEWSHPGDRVVAEVMLEAKRAVPIEYVQCTLRGWERASWGSGNSSQSHRLPLVSLRAQPIGDTVLEVGTTSYRCAFELESDLPPTYQGSRSAIAYTVDVEVSVPWWPNAKKRFMLPVKLRPTKSGSTGRSLHSTQPDGPVGTEPHVEFSLSETRLLPGDTLRGELALTNVGDNRYRTARLSLVGRETVSNGGGRTLGAVEAWRYAIEIDLARASEGEPVPFAMKLPEDVMPTFKAKLVELSWLFAVDLNIAWGKNLSAQVPVVMLPSASERDVAKTTNAVAAVGNPRVRALWMQVADAHRLRFDAEAGALVGTRGDVGVTIRRDHRSGDGIFLLARLCYPSLHLAIDGGVASGLRRVLGHGVRLGSPAWDKEHYLVGRDNHQIEGFVQPLAGALQRLRLADLSDEEMAVEGQHAGLARTALDAFVQAVLDVAGSIEPARRAIPAPAKMANDEASWRRLAGQLGGELELARMAVSGRFEGAPAHVATAWSVDGEPLHTVIALELGDTLAEKCACIWSEGRWLSGDVAELPKRAQALLDRVVIGAVSFTIEPARIELWDPAPLADAKVALTRLEHLAALAAALRGHAGPYR